jgi:predicted ATPase
LRDKHGEALSAARDEPKAQEQTGQSQWDSELRCLENITLSGLNMLEEGQNAVEEAHRRKGSRRPGSCAPRRASRDDGANRTRRAMVRDLLAPVYGWFTEGFETADLKEANVLLDQLA